MRRWTHSKPREPINQRQRLGTRPIARIRIGQRTDIRPTPTTVQSAHESHPPIDPNPAGRDFVAGDVHGEFPTLTRLLDQVGFETSRDRLFALGDLVDRRPDSAAALDWIESRRITLSVRGNHEQLLLDRITWAEEDPDAGTWGLTSHTCGSPTSPARLGRAGAR